MLAMALPCMTTVAQQACPMMLMLPVHIGQGLVEPTRLSPVSGPASSDEFPQNSLVAADGPHVGTFLNVPNAADPLSRWGTL